MLINPISMFPLSVTKNFITSVVDRGRKLIPGAVEFSILDCNFEILAKADVSYPQKYPYVYKSLFYYFTFVTEFHLDTYPLMTHPTFSTTHDTNIAYILNVNDVTENASE